MHGEGETREDEEHATAGDGAEEREQRQRRHGRDCLFGLKEGSLTEKVVGQAEHETPARGEEVEQREEDARVELELVHATGHHLCRQVE